MNQFDLNVAKISTPIAITVFNRLDCTQELMGRIKCVQPAKLYVISDGPRKEMPKESETVNTIRKYVEDGINWECELVKIYSEENMGCDRRIVTGINEVMRKEEKMIFFEDDCIPEIEFFAFCEKMLEIYQDNEEVMMISGMTAIPDWGGKEQYYFTHFALKLGWATWKRAWEKFDENMITYPRFHNSYLYCIMPKRAALYFKGTFLSNYNGRITWDSKWDYSIISNNAYGIVPRKSLVSNIGFGRDDATHSKGNTPFKDVTLNQEDRVIQVRTSIVWDKEYDKCQTDVLFHGSFRFYVREKLLYLAKRYMPKKMYKRISNYRRRNRHE